MPESFLANTAPATTNSSTTAAQSTCVLRDMIIVSFFVTAERSEES